MNKKEKILYIPSVLKIKKDDIQFLNDYHLVSEALNNNMKDIMAKYGIKNIFLSGKPFFISGKNEENRDSFVFGHSEIYSLFQIMESLLASTKENFENNNFCGLIKSEHLPRNNFDKPDVEKDFYFISYPMVLMVDSEKEPVFKSNFQLNLKDDITSAIKASMIEILNDFDEIYPIAISPFNLIAQEMFFKSIQRIDTEDKITRFTTEQGLKTIDDNGVQIPFNVLYQDGNTIVLPCHTIETLTETVGDVEKQLNIEPLREENKEAYTQMWLENYINSIIAKRTLNEIGIETMFARATKEYILEGSLENFYNDKQRVNDKVEIYGSTSASKNVIKFSTGHTEADFISEKCKGIMYFKQKGKNLSIYENNSEEILTAILVSYLNYNNEIISSENFYGDITEDIENKIVRYLEEKAKMLDKEIEEVNSFFTFTYNKQFNTILATKQKEEA